MVSAEIIGAAIAIFSAFLGALCTHITTMRSEDKKAKINDQNTRKNLYSQLFGLKFELAQCYTSLINSNLYTSYYAVLSKLKDKNSEFYIKESMKSSEKFSEMIMKVAKVNRMLFELLGHIHILFPEIKMEERITQLSEIDDTLKPTVKKMVDRINAESEKDHIEASMDEIMSEKDDLVKREVVSPINGMLEEMRKFL